MKGKANLLSVYACVCTVHECGGQKTTCTSLFSLYNGGPRMNSGYQARQQAFLLTEPSHQVLCSRWSWNPSLPTRDLQTLQDHRYTFHCERWQFTDYCLKNKSRRGQKHPPHPPKKSGGRGMALRALSRYWWRITSSAHTHLKRAGQKT